MKTISLLLFIFSSVLGSAQFIENPYADHIGQPFTLHQSTLSAAFDGEYMTFLTDHFWSEFANGSFSIDLKIEAVGFPFTPANGANMGQNRELVLPELSSYGFNDMPGHCAGWGWRSNQYSSNTRSLMHIHQAPMTNGQNSWESWPATLASHLFRLPMGFAPCNATGINRRELPHTALKHTLILKDNFGVPLDSLSWVLDHTRGRMNHYPFCGNNDANAQPQHYDVVMRPRSGFDVNGHLYNVTSNSSWIGIPSGTANYFPPPTDLNNPNLFPSNPSTFSFLSSPNNSLVAHQPPFSTIEAPMLNDVGSNYAGYTQGASAYVDNGSSGIPILHTYKIDKPINLRLINPSEQIVYNPSLATIDLATSDPLIFPSGYTFKTVHGTHPNSLDVLATDPTSLYAHPLLAPVPSTLGVNSSEYIVEAGSHLIIEPCVTLMDVKVTVKNGATVTWYSDAIDGNYTFDWQAGSTNDEQVANASKLCPSECYDSTTFDHDILMVNSNQDWLNSNIPTNIDLNQDGKVRISGILRIESGVTLNTNGISIEFGPDAKMIVERGATVFAQNTVFTSVCQTMWEGIEIWGTKNAPQLLLNGNQGWLYAIDCAIENARTGVAIFKNDGQNDDSYNGGVFRGTNTSFTNNYKDVWIKPSTVNWSPSLVSPNYTRFINCTFQTNDYLLDPTYSIGPERSAGKVHVDMEGVQRVIFTGCTFDVSLPGGAEFAPHMRGIGISAWQSAMLVQFSSFNGLSEGVVAYSTPAISGMQKFHSNTFNNTIQSLILEGVDYARITKNTINMPASPEQGYASNDILRGYDQPVGIFTLGSSFFHIEENTITGQASGSEPEAFYSYGMVVCDAAQPTATTSNWGEGDALIFRNEINGVNIGMQCERDNQGSYDANDASTNAFGLFIECNDFGTITDVYQHDITVVGDYISQFVQHQGRLRDQGSCIDNESQAGNTFSSCGGNNDHLFFSGTNGLTNASRGTIRYADQSSVTPSPGCQNLDNPTTQINHCIPGLGVRPCLPQVNCGIPCLTQLRSLHKSRISDLQGLLDNAQDTEEILALNRQVGYWKGRVSLIDNELFREKWWNEGLDSAIVIVDRGEEEYKERELIPLYIEKGDLITAMTLLIQLENKEGIPNEFTQLMRIELEKRILEQGFEELTEQEEQELENNIEQDESGAHYSKVVLRYAKGNRYARYPMPLNDENLGYRSTTQNTSSSATLQVFPNPSNGSLTVTLPMEADAETRVELFDLSGRQIKVNYHRIESNQIEITSDGGRHGIYFLFITVNKETFVERVTLLK